MWFERLNFGNWFWEYALNAINDSVNIELFLKRVSVFVNLNVRIDEHELQSQNTRTVEPASWTNRKTEIHFLALKTR